ncbi:SDR family NAD(P)-dependent oxidoreductase [Cryobacterium melibiosiphilum]|uniref:SDR family NAD(P)-dependent oxidoreductase n=1 Tax=Cryobacterium melibiosiphilum TaxID=995039 RepID=A0A3A5ML17_9MICO|nr:SDR family NAD(P)-dependent oxidoreductase [Cryobacterium melibiosiphilum]RJT89661.1 SDR family NAD(P)-dependent oxidoreductase [Cryobacterium melibiosiphilum]
MSRTVSGARVLITGAAQGLGRLYAERAVAEGAAAVILWDRDSAALAATAAALVQRAGTATQIAPYVLDISDLGAIAQTAQRVRTEIGDPDIVINNAGIARAALFWDHSNGDDTRATMQINALAPMYITREFLPAMLTDASRESRIVNIASAAGVLSAPQLSVYAASKAALIAWSDTLRLELETEGYGHVKVTTVCPSYISTGMVAGLHNVPRSTWLMPRLAPAYVVGRVWKSMLAGTPMLVLPWTVGLARALRGVLPRPVLDALVLGVGPSSARHRP